MKYSKRPLNFREQVELLVSRGLVIENPTEAEAFLNRVNYYRLSAYRLPFENAPHTFAPGTRFEHIRDLYVLDHKLRLLIMEAIESIEIATRTAVAYRISHQYGPFAHAEIKNLKPTFDHADWMTEVLKETDRSKETFVSHFKAH